MDTVKTILCQCGCGQRTPVSQYTDKRTGTVKGEPTRFIKGHTKKIGKNGHRVDPDTGCWIPLTVPRPNGYCRTRLNGRVASTHRIAYESANGPIPEGLVIDHLCRNRACCNPDHLEAVPTVENLRRAPTMKLTMDQANDIRRLRGEGHSLKAIGAIYGVCDSTVSHIAHNRRWRDHSE